MRLRLWLSLIGWTIVGAFILGVSLWPALEAQDAPAFTVGQRYVVVWSCWPAWAPQVVSTQPLNPCYAEQLEVQTIWRNGWLTVRDEQGELWTVNPAQAIGYKALVPERQVAR